MVEAPGQSRSADVAVRICPDYTGEYVQRAVRDVLEQLGGIEKYVQPGQLVALKLNLIAKKNPQEAATTHPAVVEALVREVQRAGARVVLCDSPGGPYSGALLRGVYRVTGMEGVAQRTGAELNYDTSEVMLPHPGGSIIKTLPVIKPLVEADAIIGISKLKTHGMTTFTGAVKLFYGAIPGLKKAEYHFNMPGIKEFSQLLIDIVTLVRPSLSIMDAVYGMEGDGPTAGEPRHLGLVLGSRNPFALDMAACGVIGIRPEDLPLFKMAVDMGLVPGSGKMELKGDSLPSLDTPFKLPAHMSIHFNASPFIKKIMGRWMQPRPWFHQEICAGCGECSNFCPAGAVFMKDDRAEVNMDACIRCFCCQELCPAKAVSIRQSWVGRKLYKL